MDASVDGPHEHDSGTGIARCAVHPDAPATLTCRHCGAYACPECEVVLAWGDVLCAACDAAGRGVYPIAFERGGGLVATGRAIAASPTMVFTRIGRDARAPLGRAVLFAVLSSVALGFALILSFAASMWMGGAFRSMRGRGEIGFMLLTTPFAVTAGGVFGALGAGTAESLFVRLLGGTLPLRAALRAALYTRASWLVAAPLALFSLFPFVGTIVIILVAVGMLSHEVAAHRSVAFGAGLSSRRAWTAAAGTFVVSWAVCVVTTLTCFCGAGMVRALKQMIER